MSFLPQKDVCQLTAGKKSFQDAKLDSNVTINNWKKATTGGKNRNEDFEVQINGFDEDEHLVFGEEVTWFNNDLFFCNKSVSFGYFWCVAELNDLVKTVS